jgi:hypothetical protein
MGACHSCVCIDAEGILHQEDSVVMSPEKGRSTAGNLAVTSKTSRPHDPRRAADADNYTPVSELSQAQVDR